MNYVVNSLDTQKFSVHGDIPGHEANGGGTIPPEVCITNLKPDITIWDKTNKKFHIFELTCPLMTNIDKQHEYKTNKISHRYLTLAHISHSIRNHKYWPHHTKEPHSLASSAQVLQTWH